MLSRQRLTVRGIVQGVGFRPFVYRLAQRYALSGWARNDGHGVTLELQGSDAALYEFAQALHNETPPLARIAMVDSQPLGVNVGECGFELLDSRSDGGEASIGADSGVCPACLAELFDPANRRYRYPFINCTDCGPRYTIVNRLPYDRPKTSMAAFAQCPHCLAEYRDPPHRRFHAEPNACPDCGPSVTLLDEAGHASTGDPLAATLSRLLAGQIVAIKGLGGFHLVCDARNAAAVARLRQRKQRPAKPLAVMLANAASLSTLAQVDIAAAGQLHSAERPIVLLPKQVDTDTQLPGVAPDMGWLGAMLPYTPLHHLLFHEAAGRPAGVGWLDQPQALVLVMTSANRSGEPLITDNDAARTELAGIADAWLLHDRAIVTRCDDSVLRLIDGQACFIRRARGYVPRALPLASDAPSVLALGGFFKNTVCLTRGREAFLSQHIGDTDRAANCRALESTVEHLLQLTGTQPQAIAHDRHPDFFSTQLAVRLAEQWQVPAFAIQHHHAHIAAVLAEHDVDEPVLGLALDGVGLGDDGTAWGGELLRVDGANYQRLAHLPLLNLPGADQAARQPWRMAAAALTLLGRSDEISTRFAGQPQAAALGQWLQQNSVWPQTSSMGRWFDAAAGLLGICTHNDFEGQAAMHLESLAAGYGCLPREKGGYTLCRVGNAWQLDLRPLLSTLAETNDAGYGAALFHSVLIAGLSEWTAQTALDHGLRHVACGGGCFVNGLLRQGLQRALTARGLTVLFSQQTPSGDGALALGQAWVAQRLLH